MNDITQAVESTLLSYADDSCILYQHKEVDEIEKQLNKDFENICLKLDKMHHVFEEEAKLINWLPTSKRVG